MIRAALMVLLVVTGGAEVLDAGGLRAITLTKGERRTFRVPDLDKVTGNTGRCIEEGLDTEEAGSLYVEALCGGVRTTVAWKKDGARVQLLVCAEEAAGELLPLRKALQGELRAHRGVTACVRNGRVELWGWVRKEADLQRMLGLERKHPGKVRNFVELVEAGAGG